MDMSKEHFLRFVREASRNTKSMSYQQMYTFLLHCFTRSDTDRDGKITAGEFDQLIEDAAAAPRKYGLAPKTEQMFANADARIKSRTQLFHTIDSNNDGCISFDEWLSYAMTHIVGKVAGLTHDPLVDGSKDEFVAFIKKAAQKNTSEAVDLYYFLLKCFVDADADHDGAVDASEFDRMIEIAAAAPRRHGLAPKSSDLYKTDADRLAARKSEFAKMDVNNDGKISFDEWLAYSTVHIAGKVASL